VRRLLALVALTALTLPASAQTYPQPGEGDPRIQTVQYDPTQIIRLSVAPGLQTLVELSPGENIQTIGVGDSAAWAVSAGKRGDFFFVKNVSANATTNMSVVTAARVYNFELLPSSGYGEVDTYHLKIVSSSKPQDTVTVSIKSNFEYRVSGSKAIRPSSVYQEGTRTILHWPEAAEIPGVFLVANGNEALVNGEMQDGRFIVAGTPEKLIFRLDRETAYATRKKLKAAPSE
jgi:type IV secretion system protein VirB9